MTHKNKFSDWDWLKLGVWSAAMAFCVLTWCGVIYIIWKILT